MRGACMDCHSNETEWPWYSNVAPVSWLVQNDVDEGRRRLNLSTGDVELDEMIETINEGSMPPWQYKPTHPEARLSDQERQELIRACGQPSVAAAADAQRGRDRGRAPVVRGR